MPTTEQRRSTRIELDYLKVQLEWTDNNGLPRHQIVSCMDISQKGIRFECPFPFSLGSFVCITFNPNTDIAIPVTGQVCRCARQAFDTFHVALQINLENAPQDFSETK
ncbi:MAG: PilZ domain-containing protein [Shewanella sp.]|nr:PilZ domain-containing protein [Shewanella sp.]